MHGFKDPHSISPLLRRSSLFFSRKTSSKGYHDVHIPDIAGHVLPADYCASSAHFGASRAVVVGPPSILGSAPVYRAEIMGQ